MLYSQLRSSIRSAASYFMFYRHVIFTVEVNDKVGGIMKDSAWVRLIIMNIQYTMKNLSLILKKYIFLKWPKERDSVSRIPQLRVCQIIHLWFLKNSLYTCWHPKIIFLSVEFKFAGKHYKVCVVCRVVHAPCTRFVQGACLCVKLRIMVSDAIHNPKEIWILQKGRWF